MRLWRGLLISLIALSLVVSLSTLTLAAEKLCPDNRPTNWPSNWGKWGPNDEIGTLNYITPEVMKDAAKLIKQGKVISMALDNIPQVSPKWPGRYGLIRHMMVDGADFMYERPAGTLAWTESVIQVEDHGSTHWDPLVHVWWGNCTYNGYPAPEIISRFKGVTKGSTNAYLPRSFTKGILIDVAKYLNKDYVDKIDGSAVLTPELIEKIAAAEKATITPGSILYIRTGWLKQWSGKNWTVNDGEFGVSCGIEKWLQEKQVAAIASDTGAMEAIPSAKECNEFYKVDFLPMHIGVLSMLGVPIGELFNFDEISADSAKDGVYEFATSFSPFRFINASGGLTSPTAIK